MKKIREILGSIFPAYLFFVALGVLVSAITFDLEEYLKLYSRAVEIAIAEVGLPAGLTRDDLVTRFITIDLTGGAIFIVLAGVLAWFTSRGRRAA